MAQQQSPWLEGSYGWNFGESGWNSGMDQNLLKFSFMFDRNIDSIVSSLPAAISGQAHYLTTDNRLYFAVGTTYFSTPVPKWFTVVVRSTGQTHQFNGTSLVQTDTPVQLDSRLDSVELTVSTLGTAAFQSVEFFATQAELDIVSAQSNAYTDALGAALSSTTGSTKVGTSTGETLKQYLDRLSLSVQETIKNYGGVCDGVADDSAAAAAMITATNSLVTPKGTTCLLKNIELLDNTEVVINGTAKLPANCVDFDRMFYATGKSGISFTAKELDGNAGAQSLGSGQGTHILYFTNCADLKFNINVIRDHYFPAGANPVSPDGIRDGSSGCVLIYGTDRSELSVGLLDSWGREGIQFKDCNYGKITLGHAQGYAGGGEYSGLQCSGFNNQVIRASVDMAGASGVGFDTIAGTLSNILVTNTRENHGINFGHTGVPASFSVATNLVVDGAFLNGISVGAATKNLTISNVSVSNCGESGINMSDDSDFINISNAQVEYSGYSNLNAFGAEADLRNARYSVRDSLFIKADVSSGLFTAGLVLTSSSGATATVRKVISNRSSTTQGMFLNSVVGTFSALDTVTMTGASGVVSLVYTPNTKVEQGGGTISEESYDIDTGLGTLTKFSGGMMVHRYTVSVSITAASTLTQVTTAYPSSASWIEAPKVAVSIIGVNSTDGFNVERLSCSRDTANYVIKLKADTVQTYSVDVVSTGRWK